MENISNITYLRFFIGGYFGTNSEVILNKKTVTYHTDESSYSNGFKHKKKISTDDLELFIAKLNKLKVTDWNDNYDSDVLDGEQWELKISYNDKKKGIFMGVIATPIQSLIQLSEQMSLMNYWMHYLS